ncbi:MAG: type I DNA topoisomerase [Kiritimatiellia bacterium]
MSKLFIVESPAKAHTVGNILGPDYIVKASVGHIRDLPEHSLGIAISNDNRTFEPQYIISEGKDKVVDDLVRLARSADEILLASDPDREGEAIAWHLYEVLNAALKKAKLQKPFHRIEYNEITRTAVLKALQNPHEINQNRVDAQQARRLIDRLVGFKISPTLRRAGLRSKDNSLSAGRVQSVALRIICERDREINGFVSHPYWEFHVKVQRADGTATPFVLQLKKIDRQKADINDADAAGRTESFLRTATYTVMDDKSAPEKKNPYPPFKTSTLQQAANNQLRLSPENTMRLAQKLYEAGLVTYMRTDSIALSADAISLAQNYIVRTFGSQYSNPHNYTNKEDAQAAHEAIRPTDPDIAETDVLEKLRSADTGLSEDNIRIAAKLYGLIHRNFLESQMQPAVYDRRTITVLASASTHETSPSTAELTASTSTLKFPGYKIIALKEEDDDSPRQTAEGKEETDDLQKEIPELAIHGKLKALAVLPDKKETKPPKRFSEASLVKELEARGIGRPSTYASIIRTIKERNYVETKDRSLRATDIGFALNDYLVPHFPELFDVGFTAAMEKKLDDVENPDRKIEWQSMLADFYKRLLGWLDAAKPAPADPEAVRKVLAALCAVKAWSQPRTIGKRTFSDFTFAQDIANDFQGIARTSAKERRAQERNTSQPDAPTPLTRQLVFNPAAVPAKPISSNQFNTLVRMMLRYRDQIPEVETIARETGFQELAAPNPVQAPDPTSVRIVEILENAGVEERDSNFFRSLANQLHGGRRLSDKQLFYLRKIFLNARARIPGFSPELCSSLGIAYEEPIAVDVEHIRTVLNALKDVTEWNEPKRSGKRVFSDREFFESLDGQFRKNATLSEKQISALDRMFYQYRDKIPNAAELIQRFGIQPPKPKVFVRKTRKSPPRTSTKK